MEKMGVITAKVGVITAKMGLTRGIRHLTTFVAAKMQSALGADNPDYATETHHVHATKN